MCENYCEKLVKIKIYKLITADNFSQKKIIKILNQLEYFDLISFSNKTMFFNLSFSNLIQPKFDLYL